MPEVVDLKCPGCSAPVDFSTTKCAYCGRPIVVSSFSSAKRIPPADLSRLRQSYTQGLEEEPENGEMNKSLGIVFLSQGVYDKAREKLSAAIDCGFDDSEVYYYAAIATLGGKKPNLLSKQVNEKAKQYAQAAIDLEPRGVYWYLMAYINYDYYARKHLRTDPDYKACLRNATGYGMTAADAAELFEMLGQDVPDALAMV